MKMKMVGAIVVIALCSCVICCSQVKVGPISVSTPDPQVAKTITDPNHPYARYPIELLKTCESLAKQNPGATVRIKDGECEIIPNGAPGAVPPPSPSRLHSSAEPDFGGDFLMDDPETKVLNGYWENHLGYTINVQIYGPGESAPSTTLTIPSRGYRKFQVYPEKSYRWVVRNTSGREIDSGVQEFLPKWGGAHSDFAGEDADLVQRTRTDFWAQG